MTKRFDPRLYLVAGPADCADGSLVETVRQAVEGGVTLVQYRNKTADPVDQAADVTALKDALAGTGVPILVNDRVDVAFVAEADGVHLGQSDIAPAAARQALGPEAIIGLTVKNTDHIGAAPFDVLDYVSVGGVFETQTKDNPDPPLGLDGLQAMVAQLRKHTDMPVTAIAGIDRARLSSVIRVGVDGAAVVSAITQAADVTAAARDLRSSVDACLTEAVV